MKRDWEIPELQDYWTLQPGELTLLTSRNDENRLGFALLLKFFQIEGRFPDSKTEIPRKCAAFVAEQIDIPVSVFLKYFDYSTDNKTVKNQRAQIRAYTGFRECTVDDSKKITKWLRNNILPQGNTEEQIRLAVYKRFIELRLEPPERARIDRLVKSAIASHDKLVLQKIMDKIPKAAIPRLEALLINKDEEPPDSEVLNMSDLREEPGKANVKNIIREMDKLECLRDIRLPKNLLAGLSTNMLTLYKQRVATEPLREIRRHPNFKKYSQLAIYCQLRAEEVTDTLVQMLFQITHGVDKRSENRIVKEYVADIRRVRGKPELLFRIANAALDNPDGTVRDVIFPVVGEQTLKDLIAEFKSSGSYFTQQVLAKATASYKHHYQRIFPRILRVLDFKSKAPALKPLMKAIKILSTKDQLDDKDLAKLPIEGVIDNEDKELVYNIDETGKKSVDEGKYRVFMLRRLDKRTKTKESFVPGAKKFRDPDDDLPADFENKRAQYYADLDIPTNPDDWINGLQGKMVEALTELNATIKTNDKVKITSAGKIKLTPLKPQLPPVNLEKLGDELEQRWPQTTILDVFKEAELRIGFTDEFSSVATREVLDRETIRKRLVLALHAIGTNAGLKRARADQKYADLKYIMRRFVTRDAVRTAIRRVVNEIFKVRQVHIWGEGTTSCAADSKKFGSWDQNLMTEWHSRYGGRGVMIYWHVEKNSTCIYSQLKRCSSSEVEAMIEGVLQHCTAMSVDKTYVDSHGQSEVAFAFSFLLGFQLLPRLKGIRREKLNSPGPRKASDYPNLQPIMDKAINWQLIKEQYDEMVKCAVAIKTRTADAEAILRRFTNDNLSHPTYKAFIELGRVLKTIFLCQYLGSEALRREVHEGLNVIENWNSVNGFIHFGQNGKILSNNIEDQELSMLCLHLLQVSLIYVNTLMLQEVLSEPDWSERMTTADWRGLNPLGHAHVTYGHFDCNMKKRIKLKAKAA
ncbi:MAG TPA: Tn3 family transposase [Candidatus Melainabacteria bacterium]|jgi:TnpA family transposase|nr:Tn3 family transposase [Candidatus Melainabacteria bacterium]HIN63053.1 Tn3 family transposase [Candidatus Obscuribacterales bacterium]